MDTSRERITRLYEQTVSSIDELLGQLTPEDFDRVTDCPAWTVREMVAHLGAFEAIATGLAEHAADADVSHRPHAIGFNETIERDIEVRRDWSTERIVQEFRDATLKRAEALRGMSDETFNEGTTPFPFGGASPTKGMMPIRIFDLYMHEQDIRRATGNPGHLDGEVALFWLERIGPRLGSIIGKPVKPAPGTTIVLNLTSHAGRTYSLATNDDGQLEVTDTVPDAPTVRVTMDLEAFLILSGGRRPPRELIASGQVSVHGDKALAIRILDALAVTP